VETSEEIRLARLAAARLSGRDMAEDDRQALYAAIRDAKQRGSTFEQLRQATGYSFAHLHRIVHGLPMNPPSDKGT